VKAVLPLSADAASPEDSAALREVLEHAGVRASLDELEGGVRPVLVGAEDALSEDAAQEKNATDAEQSEEPEPVHQAKSGFLRTSPVLSLALSASAALLGLGCVSLGLYAYHGGRRALGLDSDKEAQKEKEKALGKDTKQPNTSLGMLRSEKATYGLGLTVGSPVQSQTAASSPQVDSTSPELDEKVFPLLPTEPPSYTSASLERTLERFSTSRLPAHVSPVASPVRVPILLGAELPTFSLASNAQPVLTPLPGFASLSFDSPQPDTTPLPIITTTVAEPELEEDVFLSPPTSPTPTRTLLPAQLEPSVPAWSLRARAAVSPLPLAAAALAAYVPGVPHVEQEVEVEYVSAPSTPIRAESPKLPGAFESPERAQPTAAHPESRVARLDAARTMLSLVDVGDPAWMVRVLVVLIGWVFGVVGSGAQRRIAAATMV
jgi:hypothetical protein